MLTLNSKGRRTTNLNRLTAAHVIRFKKKNQFSG